MAGAAADRERLRSEVARLCVRARDPLDLFESVATLVRRKVPYVAAGWILIDPDTMLITGVYGENVDRDLHLQLVACELTEPDVNKFWELARQRVAAAALSAATDGDLARSTRWARLYGPHGYGDEARLVFATGRVPWGHACLTRSAADPHFTRTEVDLLATIAPHLGNGIRSAYLLGDLAGGDPDAAPAVVLLGDDGVVESMTPRAAAWLGPAEDDDLQTTILLHEVAGQARALAEGRSAGTPALARTRARTGEWLVVRGVRLPPDGSRGVTALVLEPARRSDMAPVLLGLHRLTDREREVTQLLLRGMAIAEIAQELWVSPETLRGHVKTVFAKLGVSSRPELAALLSQPPRSRVRPDVPASPRSR